MKRKIKDYYRYTLYLIFRTFFLVIPNFILKNLLIFSAKMITKYNKRFNKVVDANLELVYGDTKTYEEKEAIKYESYKCLLFNMYEFIENQKASKETIFSKVNVINEEIIFKALEEKKKIIFVTAHYGGWEIGLPFFALKYGKLAVVNRKMDNPHIHNMYVSARDNNNIVMIEKQVAGKGMLRALKDGLHIALVVDQHLKGGVEIDFLGKKALATDSAARLALKFDAVIIPAFIECNNFRDYTIRVYDSIDSSKIDFKSDDKIKELTQMQADVIKKQIDLKPGQWFWQHKRWKKFYKEIYE